MHLLTSPRFIGIVSLLALSAFAERPLSASLIVNYSVQAWTNPTQPTCTVNSTDIFSCDVNSVGAYSNTVTLAIGVAQTAVLFPLTVTVPANPGGSAQEGVADPSINFTFTDSVTGAQSSFQALFNVQFVDAFPQPSSVYAYEWIGPEVYTRTAVGSSGAEILQVTIDPYSENLGPVNLGGSVTYNVMATFTSPGPVPEPSTAVLMLGAVFALCAVSGARRR